MTRSTHTSIFANPYFVTTLLLFFVLDGLLFYHRFKDVWEKIVAVQMIFIGPTLIISFAYYLATKRNVFWDIINEPRNYRDFLGDIYIGLIVGVVLGIFSVSGGFSSLGLPEFNAFDATDSPVKNLRYALIPISDDVTRTMIVGVILFYILHVALSEELFAGTIYRIINDNTNFFTEQSIKALAIRSLFFSSLHIFVWNLTQPGYFLSAFLVSFTVFGPLFALRGIAAAVTAHGIYNSIVDITARTGLLQLMINSLQLIILTGLIYLAIKYVRKR